MKKFILPLILLFHLGAIYFKGYFLSIEFTLYPYLTAHGFLPYQNILDQHFPTLLFGPFSLPSFLTTNPWPLLALFLGTLLLTDVLFYFSLIRFKVKQPMVWLIFYLISSVYFSGNILWIETFVNLLLTLWLFLSFSHLRSAKFVSGFLLSQIILLRPTIFPALLFLFIGLSLPVSLLLFLGLAIGWLVPGIYLFKQSLIPDFVRLVIDFNGRSYTHLATLLPAKRQILFLFLWLLPILVSLIKNKKYFFIVSLLSFLILIFPRFGFEHLQPLFLVGVLVWSLNTPRIPSILFLLGFAFFVLNLISTLRHPYGNYFLTPEVTQISTFVRATANSEIYLLGASDLIYPLSGQIPPGGIYLPSLPWYFEQPDFVDRVLLSLSGRNIPVLVDYAATVDGYNIVQSSGRIFDYISKNFIAGPKIGSYQLFLPTKP